MFGNRFKIYMDFLTSCCGTLLIGLLKNSALCNAWHRTITIIVRYHDDGSKELNACILLLSHMVYLEPKHNVYQTQVHTYNNIHIYTCSTFMTLLFYLIPPYFPLSLFLTFFHESSTSCLLTWRSLFWWSWCEYPSTLVPG